MICPLVFPVRLDEPEVVQLAKMSPKYLLGQYLGNREDCTINFGGWCKASMCLLVLCPGWGLHVFLNYILVSFIMLLMIRIYNMVCKNTLNFYFYIYIHTMLICLNVKILKLPTIYLVLILISRHFSLKYKSF